MKINLPVTQNEVAYPRGHYLVSKTDLKGTITHANDAFVEISGYSRLELIGKSHNIVRHPDMPPEAFADLWRTVKNGLPWHGVVKNRCKNGDYYWVKAFVVPVRKSGQTVGYMSVRTEPARELVSEAVTLAADEVAEMAQSISAATVEQTQASEEVAQNMEQITQLIEGNLLSAQQASLDSQELLETSVGLKALIGGFQIHKR